MKKIDIGRAVQLLANIGVLIGILLLVYELNQNRQMTAAQTRSSLSESFVNVASVIVDSGAAELLLRAEGGEDLAPSEAFELEIVMTALLRTNENAHYQYRNGLYDEEEFLAQREAWRNMLALRIVSEIWCGRRETFSPAYVAEMDDLNTAYPCTD